MVKKVRKKTKAELASPEFKNRSEYQRVVLEESFARCERLSKKQRDFILDIADNRWASRLNYSDDASAFRKESKKWERLRNAFLAGDSKPLDLHWFSLNWDAGRGLKPIRKVVSHKNCDAGTALRLYWINDPYYYQDYRTLADCPYDEDREMLAILRVIERRFKRSDFATRSIGFDPTPWFDEKHAGNGLHIMPPIMVEPIKTRRSMGK